MVFEASSWVPPLGPIPDVPICEFMFNEKYGRTPFKTSLDPYVCNESEIRISATQQKHRVELLARGLASDLGWKVNQGDEDDKVVAVFALNTIDVPTVNWAIHRLNGICNPISASFTAGEVAELLRRSKAKALFTVSSLLSIAEEAARLANIQRRHIYLIEMKGDKTIPDGQITFGALLRLGASLPELEAIRWKAGDSGRKIAFLAQSSGTSGPPKMAAVSHRNMIANVVQLTLFDLKGRGGPDTRQIVLGMLPFSHAYGVVVISHLSTYRGDSVIVLPKFDMQQMLGAVERHRINILSIVAPIIVTLGKSPDVLRKFDLSSINSVMSGGSPLDSSSIMRLSNQYPHWVFRNAYGLTEIGACVCMTSHHDPWPGSSGVIIPGLSIKLIGEDGTEITECDVTGEAYVKSPGVIIGYVEDSEATKETFVEQNGTRWLRTGDIALFKTAPSGNQHIFLVDRMKEVIKVKGFQVVPAELEACLLTHPAVSDCAVIGIPHERDGELPLAYVQKSTDSKSNMNDQSLAQELGELVRKQKARHKWLRGGIIFIDAIPRSPSGKILRRLLRVRKREGIILRASKI